MNNIFFLEEYIYFTEDINILLNENLISSVYTKIYSMSASEIKEKLLNYKIKAIDKLQKFGFDKNEINNIINKISKKYKNIKINKISDVNTKNSQKFINSISHDIKKELNNKNIQHRFGEGKLIVSMTGWFIVAIIGTMILMTSITGFLSIPVYWFFMLCLYQLIINKYIDDYY